MGFVELDYESQREKVNSLLYKLLDSENEFQIVTCEVIYSFETISIEKKIEVHHINSEEEISLNTRIFVYFEGQLLLFEDNNDNLIEIVKHGLDRLPDLSSEDKKLFYRVMRDLKEHD